MPVAVLVTVPQPHPSIPGVAVALENSIRARAGTNLLDLCRKIIDECAILRLSDLGADFHVEVIKGVSCSVPAALAPGGKTTLPLSTVAPPQRRGSQKCVILSSFTNDSNPRTTVSPFPPSFLLSPWTRRGIFSDGVKSAEMVLREALIDSHMLCSRAFQQYLLLLILFQF